MNHEHDEHVIHPVADSKVFCLLGFHFLEHIHLRALVPRQIIAVQTFFSIAYLREGTGVNECLASEDLTLPP